LSSSCVVFFSKSVMSDGSSSRAGFCSVIRSRLSKRSADAGRGRRISTARESKLQGRCPGLTCGRGDTNKRAVQKRAAQETADDRPLQRHNRGAAGADYGA
jgi:hypothetical protein